LQTRTLIIMKNFISLIFSIFLFINILSAQTDTLTIASNCTVHNDSDLDDKEVIFKAKAGEKVMLLSRDGSREYKVQFADGQIGWINFLMFAETRTMVVDDSLETFSKPDFMTRKDEYLQKGDTVVFVELGDKQMCKVKGKNGSVWINSHYFTPLNFNDLSDENTSPWIYGYNYVLKKVKNYTSTDFIEKFGFPTSIINQNDNQRWYYKEMIVVKDKMHHNGMYFYFKDNQLIGDSIAGKAYSLWIEKMPLAEVYRNTAVGNTYNTIYQFPLFDWLDKLVKNSWILRALLFVLKLLVLALILSIPAILGRLAYFKILYIKLLPNVVVKILNWVVFVSVYYLTFLYLLLTMGFTAPTFITLISVIVLYFFWKKYSIFAHNRMIELNRCKHCHSVGYIKRISVKLLQKKHGYKTNSWRESLGSSTSTSYSGSTQVKTTTNFYQNHSNTYPVTYLNYEDFYECTHCKSQFSMLRNEMKYGHE